MNEEETWYDFDGDRSGCDDDCLGWDGSNRRCDCGNRRVSWSCLDSSCRYGYTDDKYCHNCEQGYAEAW